MWNRRAARYARILVVVLVIALLPRAFVYLYAWYERENQTGRIWAAATEQERVERFARWTAGHWRISSEKDFWNYLRKLPKPFKPDKSPTSFLSGEGLCTEFLSAARWVARDRLKITRHDIVFPYGAHSAISVRLSDGRWVFIDPFYGWAFKDGERLLGLDEVVGKLSAGERLEDYAVPLRANATAHVYDTLAKSFHARESEILDIRIRLPVQGKDRWALGEHDGGWADVQRAAIQRNLTSHLFYIGARYQNTFRITYSVPDDGRAYDIYVQLTVAPGARKLPDFSVRPIVERDVLHFRLEPGQRTLTIDSSNMRKGEWYPIDRIEVVAAKF